jgi:hypothetical protein
MFYTNKSLFVQTMQEQMFAIVCYNLEVGQNWFQCPMGGKAILYLLVWDMHIDYSHQDFI